MRLHPIREGENKKKTFVHTPSSYLYCAFLLLSSLVSITSIENLFLVQAYRLNGPSTRSNNNNNKNNNNSKSNKIIMSSEKTEQKWFPLESNPDLINDYISKLGFDTSLYEFCDVFSTEQWALDMIPQPVAAVLLLYPLTAKTTNGEDEQKAAIEDCQDKVWFIKQRIGNACGTIGLLHSLMNVPEALRASSVQPNSWLSSFSDDCPIPLSPLAKAERLESDNKIAKLHDDATSSENNATNRGNIDDDIETHFIALVCVGDKLYELDGRKEGPILHGTTSQETLLQDSCKVIQTFMARDPEETRFAITALAPKQA